MSIGSPAYLLRKRLESDAEFKEAWISEYSETPPEKMPEFYAKWKVSRQWCTLHYSGLRNRWVVEASKKNVLIMHEKRRNTPQSWKHETSKVVQKYGAQGTEKPKKRRTEALLLGRIVPYNQMLTWQPRSDSDPRRSSA